MFLKKKKKQNQKTKFTASWPITSWQTEGENMEAVAAFLFLGSKITVHGDGSHEIRRWLHLGRKAMTNLDSVLKSRDKGQYSQAYGLSSGHVWLQELDCKEGRMPKNWCLLTVVLEKTLESPLDCKEIKPVNLMGNQPWILIGRTDTEAKAPILWSPDEEPTLWERPWCQERLRREEDGINDWDGWMISLMQWTWSWAIFGRWWAIWRPGILQSMES